MSELKPCPFCKRQQRMESAKGDDGAWEQFFIDDHEDGCILNSNFVICSENRVDLVKAYNTRPVEDALVEALERCIREMEDWSARPTITLRKAKDAIRFATGIGTEPPEVTE